MNIKFLKQYLRNLFKNVIIHHVHSTKIYLKKISISICLLFLKIPQKLHLLRVHVNLEIYKIPIQTGVT